MSLTGTIWLIDIYFDFCPAGTCTGTISSTLNRQRGTPPELYWHAMKASRTALKRYMPFVDKLESHFWFCMPDPLLEKAMLFIKEHVDDEITPAMVFARRSTIGLFLLWCIDLE